MKKTLFIAILLTISLILISCGGGNTGSPADKTPPASVTPKELLQNIPLNLEEFTEQHNNARAVSVNFEDVPTMSHYGFSLLEDESSAPSLFLSFLKYDIAISDVLAFDTTIDLSSFHLSSAEAKNAFSIATGMPVNQINLTELFPNLGSMKINYKDNKLELYWKFSSTMMSDTPESMSIILQGTYSNRQYSNYAVYLNDYIAEFDFISNCSINNGKTDMDTITVNDSGIEIIRRTMDGNNQYYYDVEYTGTYPSLSELTTSGTWRRYGFKNTVSAAFVESGNQYQFFDADGSLLLYLQQNSEQNYEQIIPLHYLSPVSGITKEGDNYYLNGTQIGTIMMWPNTEENERGPVFKNISSNPVLFELPDPFSFTKAEAVQTAKTKLDTMYAQVLTPEVIGGYLSAEEFLSMKDKLTTWLATLN